MVIRFGSPVTRRNQNQLVYFAPEVLRGGQNTLKSIVFTLGTIWDEMIHYETYFKSNIEVENNNLDFRVRDNKMNPILKNTLFEMMAKDA